MSEQEVAIVTEKRGEGERGLIAQDVIYFHAESRGVNYLYFMKDQQISIGTEEIGEALFRIVASFKKITIII